MYYFAIVGFAFFPDDYQCVTQQDNRCAAARGGGGHTARLPQERCVYTGESLLFGRVGSPRDAPAHEHAVRHLDVQDPLLVHVHDL